MTVEQHLRRPKTSRRVEAIPASGIRRFFDIIATMDDVISLGVGEPDFVTPEQVREAAVRSIKQGHTHYTSNFGMIQLRQAIARDLERRYGACYDAETEMMCVSGVSEGLGVACQAVLDPGDEVLSPDPYYVAYPPNVIMAGGVFVGVPTYEHNEFKLRVEDLERYVTPRTRALLMGFPANPTGAVMTREDLHEVAEFVERHDLIVIVDDIYARLTYDGRHTCFPSLPGMKERTVLLGGFSKAFAMTGWRLGFAAAPQEILEAMMKVHQYVMMSAPTVAQYAALEALRSAEEDVQLMLAEYDRRRKLVVGRLNEMGLHCFEPRGAFYAFPDISATGLDDESFAERLLFEERVAVVPGSAFGECGRGHVRACYATSYSQLVEAMDRTERFVQRCRAENTPAGRTERRMVAEPPGGAELELAIRQVAVHQNDDGTYLVILRTTRGDLPGLMHACEGGTAAVVFLSGASGGVDGPAGGLYARLAAELVSRGITSLRLDYRRPNEFEECVLDALAGLSFLRGIGAERTLVAGHSFGAAVAIRAGELGGDSVRGVVAMSSQLHGTDMVANLSPKQLLLVHGMDDQVLEATASQIIYDRAVEPKELVLYQGAGHGLAQCSDELQELLLEWIPRVVGPEPAARN